ncbi:hypothetical protein pdam_00002771, partial [Pocillopora damicornis]
CQKLLDFEGKSQENCLRPPTNVVNEVVGEDEKEKFLWALSISSAFYRHEKWLPIHMRYKSLRWNGPLLQAVVIATEKR